MTQNHFLLDGSYPHFYFLTLDHFGEVDTIKLCQPDMQEQLNEILDRRYLHRRTAKYNAADRELCIAAEFCLQNINLICKSS